MYLYLLLLIWLSWVVTSAGVLSLVAVNQDDSNCGAWVSHCRGFFCCGPQALGCTGLSAVYALSSCGAGA